MSTILCEKKNHVATITINRPESLNCFNYETIIELDRVIDEIRMNSEVRVVVVTGAGEKAFSTGADLKERKNLSDEQVIRNLNKMGELFTKIDELPQPTIALINGYAFGGGLELALACDFRIVHSDVQLGLTETSLAIIPGAGGTLRLPRLIGEAKALELILTAKRLTGEEAFNYGVVTKVVPKEKLQTACDELINQLLANGPIALKQAKFSIKNGMKVDLQTGLKIERKAYEITIPTEDRKEALRAFQEKRKPKF
ncbi:enoyl-CoA hydratase-related protein [Bacillus carboniphilus]|uniref:Enoyl-CoA hydratase-related protein n=1 Tax=Bacillus carboniphilus TaxID=86663 RepID=A0ABY9JTY9_9BACI|nr:enoyl-CoA hydratase-related protein [Bacillus carboniphilus]WLR42864.1 enoyl-CoA hydratase-related protein [Bacillus carboniphilus]